MFTRQEGRHVLPALPVHDGSGCLTFLYKVALFYSNNNPIKQFSPEERTQKVKDKSKQTKSKQNKQNKTKQKNTRSNKEIKIGQQGKSLTLNFSQYSYISHKA